MCHTDKEMKAVRTKWNIFTCPWLIVQCEKLIGTCVISKMTPKCQVVYGTLTWVTASHTWQKISLLKTANFGQSLNAQSLKGNSCRARLESIIWVICSITRFQWQTVHMTVVYHHTAQVCSRFVSVPCEVCTMKLPNNTFLRMYLHSPLLTGANWICHLWLWLLRFAKFMVTKIYVDVGGKKNKLTYTGKEKAYWTDSDIQGPLLGGLPKGTCQLWGLAPGPAASKHWTPLRMGPHGGGKGAHTAQSLRLKNKARMSNTRAGGSPSGEGTGDDGGGGAPLALDWPGSWGLGEELHQKTKATVPLLFCYF